MMKIRTTNPAVTCRRRNGCVRSACDLRGGRRQPRPRRHSRGSRDDGRTVEEYASCEAFLAAYQPGREACLLLDAYLPGMSGLELLGRMNEAGYRLPAIMITGDSDVPMVVRAMKAGASDFIEKPFGRDQLLASIERALEQSRDSSKQHEWRESAATHVATLTPRQREIMAKGSAALQLDCPTGHGFAPKACPERRAYK